MMKYLLYDTALNGPYTLMLLQQAYPVHRSLFSGTKDEVLADAGPYLFRLENSPEEKMGSQPQLSLQALVELETEISLEELAAHLGKFLYQTIRGRECFFRFWDGRVLRSFLPSCTREQILTFFGPVHSFTMEAEAGGNIQFTQEGGRLKMQAASVGVSRLQEELTPSSEKGPAVLQDPALPPPKKRRSFLG